MTWQDWRQDTRLVNAPLFPLVIPLTSKGVTLPLPFSLSISSSISLCLFGYVFFHLCIHPQFFINIKHFSKGTMIINTYIGHLTLLSRKILTPGREHESCRVLPSTLSHCGGIEIWFCHHKFSREADPVWGLSRQSWFTDFLTCHKRGPPTSLQWSEGSTGPGEAWAVVTAICCGTFYINCWFWGAIQW